MKDIVLTHIQGKSFRSIAESAGFSAPTAYRAYLKASKDIPVCIDVTRNYCSRFCGILLVDDKYVKVRGYKKKIPVIYGVERGNTLEVSSNLFVSVHLFFENI